ncbi:hypothetical protein [Spiroplasma poulsonii]|uniref:Uncharacterized protein n=1 Tax=Spiroplasma poulsonii TaxID=2138 RepID=A0A2P6FCD5_9MOLU|nr:hypothetical protein [Spiroplasma poulsonii]KAF0851531.1 transmembrane protein [Spiroplasma poulsonii]PQM31125.1 hypothetical protein SMSRO_SF009280 [Spiroplasma poulsonii]PWF98901.1 hypothetical protein SMH99_14640 [Spiroplasma poulsonii]
MDDQKGTIISIAMAAFLFVAVSLSIIGYLISFTKQEFKERFVNKKILIILFTVLGINLPVVIVGFLLEFVIKPATNAPVIAVIVIAFVLTVAVGVYIFLFLQTIAIGIDEKEIAFLGERILIRKINRVERNDKTNQLIIHYTEGSRSKKKTRFSLASQAGQFMVNNVSLLNQEIMMFVPDSEQPADSKPTAESTSETVKETKKD